MVQARPTSAFDDTAEEAFQHHLLHQVSHDTVLKPQKREGHARAAAWLTQRVGDRSDEYLGITAEHCARAGEAAQAADWFYRASTRAAERFAFKTSLQYLDLAETQAALQTEPLLPERKARMLAMRARLSDNLALRGQQAQAIDALLALGEAHGELRWIASALTDRSLLAYRTGRLELAEAAGRRGAEVAEQIDKPRYAALCRGNLAYLAFERREFDLARPELAAASRWATLARQRMENPEDGIYAVQMLLIEAELPSVQNNGHARGTALTRALAIAGTLHVPRLECSCRSGVAQLAQSRAELTLAAVHIEEMARLAAEFGLAHQAATAQALRARMQLQAGQWDAAERDAAAGGASYSTVSDVVAALQCRKLQAEALWRGGQAAAAVRSGKQPPWPCNSAATRLARGRCGCGWPMHRRARARPKTSNGPGRPFWPNCRPCRHVMRWPVLNFHLQRAWPAGACCSARTTRPPPASWRWRRPNWSKYSAASATPRCANGCATPCPGTATWSRRLPNRSPPLEAQRAADSSGAPPCRRLGPGRAGAMGCGGAVTATC
jgi:hypothetical protein